MNRGSLSGISMVRILLAVVLGTIPLTAAAVEGWSEPEPPTRPAATVNLRVDNDLFASRDRGYTSGIQLTVVSPNLADYTADTNLPRFARWLNDNFEFMQPAGAEQQNMVLRIEQRIYTPTDPLRSDLDTGDRPYAGTLMAVAGYNARKGNTLRTTLLGVGILGPSSLAERSQDAIHDLTGSEKFAGWEHQLKDEILVGVRHERSYRTNAFDLGRSGLQGDAISHWGAALGNPMTRINGGFEFRVGHNLPDDFGSSPVRPAGDNTAPPSNGRDPSFAWHVFLAVDTYWSIYDPSLDGNLFHDSHDVDKKSIVAETALGFTVNRGPWKLAFARYFRTREFNEQHESPRFGSVTLSRSF
ncbi:lipid A deacylase LpxR family protein [Lysobacter sp. A286]